MRKEVQSKLGLQVKATAVYEYACNQVAMGTMYSVRNCVVRTVTRRSTFDLFAKYMSSDHRKSTLASITHQKDPNSLPDVLDY